MKPFCAVLLLSLGLPVLAAESHPEIRFQRKAGQLEVSWPATLRTTNGLTVRPWFELQQSADLRKWDPLGERFHSPEESGDTNFVVAVTPQIGPRFYRLLTATRSQAAGLARAGAEMFGYAEAFQRELLAIGELSSAEFQTMFESGSEYLPGISWDPTTAAFWPEFNADPAVLNQGKTIEDPEYRTFDFRLNPAELAVFKQNGFVVSQRLGSRSFADVLYNIWHNDLPVFVSTDAILQAWHRTYDSILEETEETFLHETLRQILDGMVQQIPDAAAEAGDGVLKESVQDADYFLAVARSALAGAPVSSWLGQDQRVAETLADIRNEQMVKKPDFLGECRVVDFSQFKVRGHYTHTPRLARYFQAMMWLGRIDFGVAGGPFERCPGQSTFASPREMGGAIVLCNLLQRSGNFEKWRAFDRIIEAFAGWSDSMNFAQLGGLLAAARIRTLSDLTELAEIRKLQEEILRGDLGVQNIRSDYFASPMGSEQIQLPRAFLVFGQRFVPDSWAFSQTVFDSIRWGPNGTKVQRRVPSALDAAFAIMGNDQIVPELVERMNNTEARNAELHAERWRDGLPYQHNLAAVRRVIDSQSASTWESSIYMAWLAALRELSAPTTAPEYPETMRTRPWAMKTLNTQLASWTHLRHDNILYAKQSYTGGGICAYPSGFVEPRVKFWNRLRQTAERAASLIGSLPFTGHYEFQKYEYRVDPETGQGQSLILTNTIPLSTIRSNQVAHLGNFATVLGQLENLSQKELRQECFTDEEELFIRNLIQKVDWSWIASERHRKFDGWYPRLFYRGAQFDRMYSSDTEIRFQSNYGANAADLVVVDVHTDAPFPGIGDPGSVLHQGVGEVHLLMCAIDNGHDRMIYAGPVLSHFEFEVTGSPRRLDDGEWHLLRLANQAPEGLQGRIEGLAAPRWTESYLVPR